MSAREYVEAYFHMTEDQRKIMYELWMSAVNHDGHAWVRETEVKIAMYDLFTYLNSEEIPIVDELFANKQVYDNCECVTYGAIEKAVGAIVLGRRKNGRGQDKNV